MDERFKSSISIPISSDVWGIAPEALANHLASVSLRAQQLLELKQYATQPGQLDPWGSIVDPLEIVTLEGSDAHIDVCGVVLSGSAAIRWLVSEGRYNDPKLIADAINLLENNQLVNRIILHVNTPGGNVSFCYEVGNTIKNSSKSIVADINGQCCSAGFWYTASADMVVAGKMDVIGSIGTMIRLVDSSRMYESVGLKVHVVSTGELKGSFTEGKPISESELAYAQELVDGINNIFMEFISSSRPGVDIKLISSGKTWLAEEAKTLGLIDSVRTYEPKKKQKENQMDFKSLYESLTTEQKQAFDNEKAQAKAEAEAKADALAKQLHEVNATAKLNKYLEEVKSFGNLPGLEQSETVNFLMVADESKIGDFARKLITSSQRISSESPILKPSGVTPKVDLVSLNTNDEFYSAAHKLAEQIASEKNVPYGTAFLEASKQLQKKKGV